MVRMDNNVKKLDSVKASFNFETQDDDFDLNFKANMKTKKPGNHINILNRKNKRKTVDASTKLF